MGGGHQASAHDLRFSFQHYFGKGYSVQVLQYFLLVFCCSTYPGEQCLTQG